LRDHGLSFEVCSESYYPDSFGNAIVLCKAGTLLLKFMRDRSQDMLELASTRSPDCFHIFIDVEIAMGWKSLDEVKALEDVPPVEDEVRRLAENFDELSIAIGGDPARFTRARLMRAACRGLLPTQGGLH
jgi:hypothetical protein